MTDPMDDSEQIAALLDGRLDARAREALLARLSASEDGLALLADAAAVLREVEAEEAGGAPALATQDAAGGLRRDVVPLIRQRRWLMLAAAAVVAAVALWSWPRSTRPDALADPSRLVAMLQENGDVRSASVLGLAPPAWGDARATGGASLAPRARAVRLGVRLVELEVAVRAGDSAAVVARSAEVVNLLEGSRAPVAPLAAAYADVGRRAASPADSLARRLGELFDETARVAGDDDVRLGAWLQAARVAAARHDARFFTAPASRTALARAPLDPVARPLREMGPSPIDAQWSAIARRLDELVLTLGS